MSKHSWVNKAPGMMRRVLQCEKCGVTEVTEMGRPPTYRRHGEHGSAIYTSPWDPEPPCNPATPVRNQK